jgi:hypothetical protein
VTAMFEGCSTAANGNPRRSYRKSAVSWRNISITLIAPTLYWLNGAGNSLNESSALCISSKANNVLDSPKGLERMARKCRVSGSAIVLKFPRPRRTKITVTKTTATGITAAEMTCS